MKQRLTVLLILTGLLAAALIGGCRTAAPPALRLGYFANLTHAQAVLGVADGSFARATGTRVTPRVFAAGPAAITALLAGEVDILYVGPSPAVNGYIRSDGKALRIVAGAASGGAVFVVRPGVDPADLAGARLASPGLGNTQDVALRHLLAAQGLKTTEKGGPVRLTPMANADILNLMKQGQLDGAWVPEPWGARLIREGGARIAIDERELWPDRRFATTVVVVAAPYLAAHGDIVRSFLGAHVALTRWLAEHPTEAQTRLKVALQKLQGRALPDPVLSAALSRVDFVVDPMADSMREQARRAYALGLLGGREPDLSGLFAPERLKEVSR